jgi:tryptophan synthase alpha chain
MNRIEKRFKELKKKKQKAFIAFITAGYPSLEVTRKLIMEFDRIGVDVLELGVPFSDPMADGPMIQETSQAALKKGTRVVDIMNLVKSVRSQVSMPICLMTYYNPIFCFGEDKFAELASRYGIDGVIIPDLPPEEAKSLLRSARKSSLDVIFFIAPTTSAERAKYIVKNASGFIYYVSLTGVTGMRQGLPKDLIKNLKAIKRLTAKPVCAGFGVSTPGQIAQINKIADGVIVGSAIVRKIKENTGKPDLAGRVSKFVRLLKS